MRAYKLCNSICQLRVHMLHDVEINGEIKIGNLCGYMRQTLIALKKPYCEAI